MFFLPEVRSWSFRTGPDNFGGPVLVRKDLDLLGPLVHYLLPDLFRFVTEEILSITAVSEDCGSYAKPHAISFP